jgi:uncharacterized protein (DUF305 family)
MRSIVTIILIVLTLLVAGLAYAIATSSPDKSTEASLPKTTADQDEEAASTSDTYTALQGDAFDEQYIAGMFAHHEGAVNMSEKALAFAGKQEIKDLANDIVQSQSREMTTLLDWQEKWGYERTYNGGHNGHTGGGAAMADDMIGMQDSLEGKEGKEFDVIFLKQMIIHHTQAIDMSKPAATNAKRDEIKTFAHNVITAQEKEIQLMKQWQQEWGY